MSNETYTALVECEINPDNSTRAEWLATWDPRAVDAFENEPETTTYAATLSSENALNVMIYERYLHGSDSLKKHRDRPSHAALLKTSAELKNTRRLVHATTFVDIPDFGWWERADSKPDLSQEAGNALLILGLRFADEEQRQTFIRIASEHAQNCYDDEPETLVFSGGIASQDSDSELDLKAGDVVLVMISSDASAIDRLAIDPRQPPLREQLQQAGVTIEPVLARKYVTSGNGYLWR